MDDKSEGMLTRVKFGCMYTVPNTGLEGTVDYGAIKLRYRERAAARLGEKIFKVKENIWEARKNRDLKHTEYTTTLYVFTPDELREWKTKIIEKIKSGEIK